MNLIEGALKTKKLLKLKLTEQIEKLQKKTIMNILKKR